MTRTLPHHSWRIVAALSITETVSRGTLFYAFAVLLVPMQDVLRLSTAQITAALSIALAVAGGVGVGVGRYLDKHSPRALMTGGSLLATFSLACWSRVNGQYALYLTFGGIGVAMACVFYDPAFIVIAKHFPGAAERRRALSIFTLGAATASFIFSPTTQWLSVHFGWRSTLLILAILVAVITVPLHALTLRPAPPSFPLPQLPGKREAAVTSLECSTRVQTRKGSLSTVPAPPPPYRLSSPAPPISGGEKGLELSDTLAPPTATQPLASPLSSLPVVLLPSSGRAVSASLRQTMSPQRHRPPSLHDDGALTSFGLLVLSFLLNAFITVALSSYVVLLLLHADQSPTVAAFVAGTLGLAQVPGRLFLGTFGQRLTARFLPLLISGLAVLAFSLLFMSHALLIVFGFALLEGISSGMVTLIPPILLAELYGTHRFGQLTGISSAAVAMARAAAPLIVGLLAQSTAGDRAVLETLILASVLSAIFGFTAVARLEPIRRTANV